MKKIKRTRFWARNFPKYIKIGDYILAMWTHEGWESFRVTIRDKDNMWLFTIKQGDHEDNIRCSKDFKPFGINLQRFFKNGNNRTTN